MHAPRASCQALYRLHPQLRLAWRGRERASDDDLNPGSFALVQLYHISDAGTPDEPRTFTQRWEPDYGPIFDRNGGGIRDWDPLFRVPMYIADLKAFGISTEDVMSGAFLARVREWFGSSAKKARAQREKLSIEFDDYLDDLGAEMTDYLWHEGNKTGATSVDVPKEFQKPDVERMYQRKQQAEQQLKDYVTK